MSLERWGDERTPPPRSSTHGWPLRRGQGTAPVGGPHWEGGRWGRIPTQVRPPASTGGDPGGRNQVWVLREKGAGVVGKDPWVHPTEGPGWGAEWG